MAALPNPPDATWADAITRTVEELLIRVEAIEHVTKIVVAQAEQHRKIRDANFQLEMLNDSLLIVPTQKQQTTQQQQTTQPTKKIKLKD